VDLREVADFDPDFDPDPDLEPTIMGARR